jgi:hypothetical protein
VLSMVVAAIGLSVALHGLGRVSNHPSPLLIPIVALLGVAIRIAPIGLPETGWRVPRSWARFGHTAYASLFGAVLGVGFLTAIPAAGFYVLLAWGVAAPSWNEIWPVFAAFAGARAMPFLIVALATIGTRSEPVDVLERIRRMVTPLIYIELTLLTLIAIMALALGRA